MTSDRPGLTTPQYSTASGGPFSYYNETLSGMCVIREFTAASSVVQIVIAIVILVPNAAVIKVIFTSRQRRYKRSTYSFIASLSIADALVAVYVIISVSLADVGGIELTPLMWAVMYICGSIPFYSSVLHLLVIAVDRLLYIGYYSKYHVFMTKNVVIMTLSVCWGLSLLPVLPLALGVGACGDLCECLDGGKLECREFSCSSILIVFTKSMLLGNSFFFFLVMIIISFLYYLLFRKVNQQSTKVSGHSVVTSKITKRINKEYKLARTLAVVISIFFAFWGPLMIAYIVDFALPYEQRIGETVTNIILIPNLLNSVSNPIIYAVRLKHMREEMLPSFCKRMKSNTPSATDTSDTLGPDTAMRKVKSVTVSCPDPDIHANDRTTADTEV